ncbi:MAG: thiamine-phosphate kinase [Candidatus Acidiferrum sp.]
MDSPELYSALTMRKAKHPSTERLLSGEAAVLKRIQRLASGAATRNRALLLGIGDDAALVKCASGFDEILTCDWFLEGTHFLRDRHPPDSVGWKCLARAVSDVAAMGGVPRCFLLSLALPVMHTGSWLEKFLGGLRRAANRFGCPLAGGDTTQRHEILINVTVVGEVRTGHAGLRSGARQGDVLFVSGQLGEAELGLEQIRRTKGRVNGQDPILRKHLYPEPRLALGRWLREKRLASAMMDLSDGLSTDLPRLCKASGVGARIEASTIPLVHQPKARRKSGLHLLSLALHGGDDYELLFTVPRAKLKQVPHSFQGIPIAAIGEITKKRSLVLIDDEGRSATLPNRGWDPFRSRR